MSVDFRVFEYRILLPSFTVRSSGGLWSPSRPLSGSEYGAELLNQTWLKIDRECVGVAETGWASSLLRQRVAGGGAAVTAVAAQAAALRVGVRTRRVASDGRIGQTVMYFQESPTCVDCSRIVD